MSTTSSATGHRRDGAASGYAGAVDHYTSPRRRDAVKRHWEEPATRRLLQGVVSRLGGAEGRPLRVLDVGCGAGGGLSLLRSTAALRDRALEYVGLDLDPHLLAVARARHARDPDVAFVRGDIRDGVPVRGVDLYLSTGVPYSHLTRAELEETLAGVFGAARHHPRPVAVVIDVLGRYSVEWPDRWDRSRWTYRMSFFEGEQDPPTARMTCYGGAELRALVERAARSADCGPVSVTCHDRSVLVGRHTSTGEYAPGLPPYRDLVNALWDPRTRVDLAELRADPDLPAGPARVDDFHARFAVAWNARLERAEARAAAARDEREIAADVQPALASELASLEAAMERGLGVGHSLTAVALVAPADRARRAATRPRSGRSRPRPRARQ